MHKPLISGILIALLSLASLSHAHNNKAHGDSASAAQHDQVAQQMKQMQRAYKKAVRSQTIAQMKPAVMQLIALSKQATAMPYDDDPTTRADYKKGMRALQADLDQLKNAMQANNLPLARKILTTQIKATRNQAHEKLDVDED